MHLQRALAIRNTWYSFPVSRGGSSSPGSSCTGPSFVLPNVLSSFSDRTFIFATYEGRIWERNFWGKSFVIIGSLSFCQDFLYFWQCCTATGGIQINLFLGPPFPALAFLVPYRASTKSDVGADFRAKKKKRETFLITSLHFVRQVEHIRRPGSRSHSREPKP